MRRCFVLMFAIVFLALLSQQASAQTYFVGSDNTLIGLTPFNSNRNYMSKTITVPRPPGNGTWQLRIVASGYYTGGDRVAYLQTAMRGSGSTAPNGPFIQIVSHQVSTTSQQWTDTRNFIYGATTNQTLYCDIDCTVQGQNSGSTNKTTVWSGTFEVYWDFVGP